MSVLVHPTEGRLFVLNRWSPGGLDLWVILFKTNITVDANTVFSDLVEADFSGYARSHPTWSSPANDGSGNAESHPSAITFSHDGGGTSNTIYGLAVCPDSAGLANTILCAYKFPSPISMSTAADSIIFTPKVIQGQFPIT